MGRVALRGIRAHLVRFLLSLLAVALGVSFIAGTFSLRTMLSSTFTGIVDASMTADAYVRGADDAARATASGSTVGETRNRLPLSLADDLAKVDGVKEALPDVNGLIVLVGADGTAVQSTQAPSLGLVLYPNDPSYEVIDGRAPEGPGEVALEMATLESSGLKIGDTTRVVISGEIREVEITGEVDPGGPMAGATMVFVDPATARAEFAPDGMVETISIFGEEGVSEETLVANLSTVTDAASVPAEAVTGTELREAGRADIEGQLGFISTFLLVFASISLFVGAFIIANTFSMSVRQRMREFALLRAVGASPLQVFASILLQAAVVGIIGSALGVAGGLGLVSGLRVMFESMGMSLGSDIPLDTSTVVISLVVGTVVSVAAAFVPARRAALVPPVEAMRDDVAQTDRSLRVRAISGTVLAGLGAAAVVVAAVRPESDAAEPLLACGAVGVVIGMLLLAPVIARATLGVLAVPFVALVRPVGRLARANVVRNPRRTANTAGALMIGMALVGGASVLAASTQVSLGSMIENEATADFIMEGGTSTAIPEQALAEVRALPEVEAADPLYFGMFLVGEPGSTPDADSATSVLGTDPATFERSLKVEEDEGDLVAALGSGQIALQSEYAESQGWGVGDELTFVGDAGTATLTVGSVFTSHALGTSIAMPDDVFDELIPATKRVLANVFVTSADVPAAQVREALTTTLSPYIVVSVQDSDEFVASIADQVNQMLTVLYALLGLSIIIAVLGIVNTLALSVIERTREIGLLRAVGLGRLQLSGTVTIESVLTAVFGTVVGLGVGVALAAVVPRVYQDSGLTTLAIPWGSLVAMLVLAVVVGVLAALWPASRAARLPVLDAVSYE
ncbi:FtsX-like permease family protein [Cellulomonas sp. P22]|uniref:FtsX-like permease family protein n=1 Tax=Cellulomonas sp. P22 TaxID=3373189 RepID=UPI003787D02A